jgi:hypothetical protein
MTEKERDEAQPTKPEPVEATSPQSNLGGKGGAAGAGLTDEDLESAFHAWVSTAPSVDDEPLDWGLDDEPDPLDPDAEARRLATRRISRGILLVLVTLVSIFAMKASWTNMRYALTILQSPEAIDLGDLRRRYETEKTLDVASNSYIRFRSAIPTLEAVSRNGKYAYFYSPLYKMIVQTTQDLPVKRQAVAVEIPAVMMDFVNRREIFPFDLTARVHGQGRIFHAEDVPAAVRPVLDYYRPRVDAPVQELVVFFDGDTPRANLKYAFLYLGGLLAFLASLFAFRRTAVPRTASKTSS